MTTITKAGRVLATEIGAVCSDCLKACSLIVRHAKTYARIQERWCNDAMSAEQARALENKESTLEKTLTELALSIPGIKGVKFTGDPRGYCVRLMREDGKYNTWGGAEDGWGVA